MAGDAVFVDTNVLLTAVTPARPLHRSALAVLGDDSESGRMLFTSGQVLREWLVVATRPTEVNGLGLNLEDALHNIAAFRSRLVVLEETERVVNRLLSLVATYSCTGKQVHDANIVATALVHGVRRVLTSNTADLRRFAAEVEVLDLAQIGSR